MDLIKNIIFVLCILVCCACPPQEAMVSDEPIKPVPLSEIYLKFKGGEIEECLLEMDTVYKASINAYDAPTEMYNSFGTFIGTCNYAYNLVDSICEQTQSCRVIYRGVNHISGQPAVDIYGLEEEN
jgi:hypothetical protein